ncbi:MFS transporter [Pseudoalteromonas piscicida]|uniref:MFS transporter n=1 Tax=Pseudoalteromonas piscicida TaxID=43662 RepID=UPI0030CA0BA9
MKIQSVKLSTSIFNIEALPIKLTLSMMMAMMAIVIDGTVVIQDEILASFELTNASESASVKYVLIGFFIGLATLCCYSNIRNERHIVLIGSILIVAGSILCLVATTYESFLLGRSIQGLGCAFYRVACLSIIRAHTEGIDVSHFMSDIMILLMLTPVLFPIISDEITALYSWKLIFIIFLIFAFIVLIVSQKLFPTKDHKVKNESLTLAHYFKDTNMLVFSFLLGLLMGSILTYVTSVRGIYQEHFQVTSEFSYYFSMFSLGGVLGIYISKEVYSKIGLKKSFYLSFSLMLFLSVVNLIFSLALYGVTVSLILYIAIASPMVGCFGVRAIFSFKFCGVKASALSMLIQMTISIAFLSLSEQFIKNENVFFFCFALSSILSLTLLSIFKTQLSYD